MQDSAAATAGTTVVGDGAAGRRRQGERVSCSMMLNCRHYCYCQYSSSSIANVAVDSATAATDSSDTLPATTAATASVGDGTALSVASGLLGPLLVIAAALPLLAWPTAATFIAAAAVLAHL